MDYVLRQIDVGEETETVTSAVPPWHDALQRESDELARSPSQTVIPNADKRGAKRETFATTTEFESQSDVFLLEKASLECVREGRGRQRLETDTLGLHVSSRRFGESCDIFIVTRMDRKEVPVGDIVMATSCTGLSEEEALDESIRLLENLKAF